MKSKLEQMGFRMLSESIYMHSHFMALWTLSWITQVSCCQNQSGFFWSKSSGISWAICKSAPCPRQITMPTPHHSVLQARCPSCLPANSVKALKALHKIFNLWNKWMVEVKVPITDYYSCSWLWEFWDEWYGDGVGYAIEANSTGFSNLMVSVKIDE